MASKEVGHSMGGVAEWFETRGEIPLVCPPRVREYGPLSDDGELPDAHFNDDRISGVAFAMEYCDSRGWASTRTVRSLGLTVEPVTCLRAFCNVRDSIRCFRVDRIISIYDLRSGRMLTGAEHVALLSPYLPGGDDDAQAMRELQAVACDGVAALLQLAMPEGRLGDGARALVLDYVRAEAAANGCALPSAFAIELWIDNFAPPKDAVGRGIDALLAKQEKFARLLPWLLKIMRSRDDFAVQEDRVRQLISEVRLHYRRKTMDQPAHGLRATR